MSPLENKKSFSLEELIKGAVDMEWKEHMSASIPRLLFCNSCQESARRKWQMSQEI